MSTYKVKRPHIARTGLSFALSSACLLALCILLRQTTEAGQAPKNELAGSESVLPAPLVQANGAYTQYMPAISRNYGALINGDFERGLDGWETERGPFQSTGSGLPVGTVALSSGNSALLGLASAINGAIPVGYGTLYQSFIVYDRYLQFRYLVYSYDVAYSNGRYRDTFEVSINRGAAHVSDVERNARGCSGAMLNPQAVLAVPADGLVFCAGRPGTSGGVLWSTAGWRTVTLDLNAYLGQWITLVFGLWSREYELPYTSDAAWYNTWAYVDAVYLGSSPAVAGRLATETDLPSPILSTEARTAHFPWNVEGVGPAR